MHCHENVILFFQDAMDKSMKIVYPIYKI